MARATLIPQVIDRTGVAPTYNAVALADGMQFNNAEGNVILHVKNTGGTPATITIQTPGSVDGMAIPDKTVSVPATTGERLIGPFPKNVYNNTANLVLVDVSAAVTIALYKI